MREWAGDADNCAEELCRKLGRDSGGHLCMQILSGIPRARKNCDRTNLRSAKTRTRTPGPPTPRIRGRNSPLKRGKKTIRQNSNEKPRGRRRHAHNRGGEEKRRGRSNRKRRTSTTVEE